MSSPLSPILQRRPRKLLQDRRGAVGVLVGMLTPVVLGFAALGVEAGMWFAAKRSLQTAADAAAVSAAMELSSGLSEADVIAAAEADAARNGVTAADQVTVNNPPLSGTHTADDGAVEVVVRRSQTPLFSKMFLSQGFDISARAVALAAIEAPYAKCFLALDPDDSGSVYLQNNAELPENCGVAVNSNHAQALLLKNNAKIYGTASVVGGYKTENNSSIATVKTGAQSYPDPYAAADPGPLPACSPTPCQAGANKKVTLNPGRYCGGCDLGNNATVTLNPGTYFVQGQLKMQNNVKVTGSNVTFVLVDNATMSLSNNATISINAPTSGSLSGIAFMSEHDSPFLEQKLSNNVHLAVNGAFYFPNQKLTIENNTNTPGGCTQFVAKNLLFKNNADLDNQCAGTGVKPIVVGGPVKLVE
jgi:hypothetical protein